MSAVHIAQEIIGEQDDALVYLRSCFTHLPYTTPMWECVSYRGLFFVLNFIATILFQQLSLYAILAMLAMGFVRFIRCVLAACNRTQPFSLDVINRFFWTSSSPANLSMKGDWNGSDAGRLILVFVPSARGSPQCLEVVHFLHFSPSY